MALFVAAKTAIRWTGVEEECKKEIVHDGEKLQLYACFQ